MRVCIRKFDFNLFSISKKIEFSQRFFEMVDSAVNLRKNFFLVKYLIRVWHLINFECIKQYFSIDWMQVIFIGGILNFLFNYHLDIITLHGVVKLQSCSYITYAVYHIFELFRWNAKIKYWIIFVMFRLLNNFVGLVQEKVIPDETFCHYRPWIWCWFKNHSITVKEDSHIH